jgi:hypothetical protein
MRSNTSVDPITADLAPVLAAAVPLLSGAARDARVRSVHSHGSNARSVLLEVDVVKPEARDRTVLLVAHVASRTPPPAAASLLHHGEQVHLWLFPRDPYLPGLAAAVDRRAAGALLAELQLGSGSLAAVRTRAYRPTRRAVVELRPATGEAPAAYRKVLGGRSPQRVHERALALADVHRALSATLPVPPVLHHDREGGVVTLGRLAGDTLRSRLRRGLSLPPPSDVADLLDALKRSPDVGADGDPARYADVRRHVRTLAALLPDRAADLEHVHACIGEVGGPRGLLHGDLHDGQLLVESDRITGLLDVDGVGRGPIALDVGRLLANIEVAEGHGPEGARVAPAYARAVEAATRHLAPESEIAKAAAAAWIGLATGPHRVQSTDWHSRCNARIDRALGWAERIA